MVLVSVSLVILCVATLASGTDSLPELRLKAERGDSDAQFSLGLKYAQGDGVLKDDAEAVKWYKMAAEQGDTDAQFNLGLRYSFGRGVPENDVEALKWYRMAAEQGNPNAQYNLGLMYENGEGIPKNDSEALKWYRMAAEKGVVNAQYILGLRYAQGRGVLKNDAEAVKWYRMAAEQGDTDAQFNLGLRYSNGWGVLEDDVEAIRWYRLAAEKGNSKAQFNLGLMYDNGKGVPENDVEAVKWYQMAAEQGDSGAQTNLGHIFNDGVVGLSSSAEAAKWYRMAAAQGNAEAQYNLGNLYATGKILAQGNTEAFKWFLMAAEQGHSMAQRNLGRAYYLGEGVPEDYIEAYKWIILAAAQGDKSAQEKKSLLAAKMTPSMIAAAQDRARNWQPKSADPGSGQAVGQNAPPQEREPASSGSGFFINARGDLITNFHVVDGCSSLRIWFAGKPYTANLLKSDNRNDLALLNAGTLTTAKQVTLRLAGSVALGELALVAGYPLRGLLADSLNISLGNVSSLAGPKNDTRVLQISAPVQPGNSGGPVIDQYGLVIGVVVSKLDTLKIAELTGDVSQNVNFAIKGAILRSFLEVNDTEYLAEAPGQTMKTEEIAANARRSTVAVECME